MGGSRLLIGGALAAGVLILLGWETWAQADCRPYVKQLEQCKGLSVKATKCETEAAKLDETLAAKTGELTAKAEELAACLARPPGSSPETVAALEKRAEQAEASTREAQTKAKDAEAKAAAEEAKAEAAMAKAKDVEAALGLEIKKEAEAREEERAGRLKAEKALEEIRGTIPAETIARLEKELDEAKGQLDITRQKLAEANERIEELSKTADRLRAELAAAVGRTAERDAILAAARKELDDTRHKLAEAESTVSALRDEVGAAKRRLADASTTIAGLGSELKATQARGAEVQAIAEGYERQIVSALNGLVEKLHEKLECGAFSIEMRDGAGVLKGTVVEAQHRDEAREMLGASLLKPLVKRVEIDLGRGVGSVCFERTRAPGWTMARDRKQGELYPTLFLITKIESSPALSALLPPASDCRELGAVLESLEPLDPRPFERDAVWVQGKGGLPALCDRGDNGQWRVREVLSGNTTREGWILLPERPGGAGK
jgi:hypothetical protein